MAGRTSRVPGPSQLITQSRSLQGPRAWWPAARTRITFIWPGPCSHGTGHPRDSSDQGRSQFRQHGINRLPENLGKTRGTHRRRTQVLGIFCLELTPYPREETVLSPLPAPETGVP